MLGPGYVSFHYFAYHSGLHIDFPGQFTDPDVQNRICDRLITSHLFLFSLFFWYAEQNRYKKYRPADKFSKAVIIPPLVRLAKLILNHLINDPFIFVKYFSW